MATATNAKGAFFKLKSMHDAFDDWCEEHKLKFWHDMFSGHYLFQADGGERQVLQDTTLLHKQSTLAQMLLHEPFYWQEPNGSKQGFANCKYTAQNLEKHYLNHFIEFHAKRHGRCINALQEHYKAIEPSNDEPTEPMFGNLWQLDYEQFASFGICKEDADEYALEWSKALAIALYTAGMYPERKMRLMFIIHSPEQEIGKDMFTECLTPNEDWHTDSISIDDFMHKDSSELCRRLRGIHITVFSDSSAGQKNKAKLKKAVSARKLHERIMYKASRRMQFRTDVMMLTANETDLIPADNEYTRFLPLLVKGGHRFDSEKAAKAYIGERLNKCLAWARHAVDVLGLEPRLPNFVSETHKQTAAGVAYSDESMEVRIKDALARCIDDAKQNEMPYFPTAHFQRVFAEMNKHIKPATRMLAQICGEHGVSKQIKIDGQKVRRFSEDAVSWARRWTGQKKRLMPTITMGSGRHDHHDVF